MIRGMAVDTGTMLVLAAVALLEGLTRVPAGALILRRRLGGSWKVAGAGAEAARLRLVHFWPPSTETLVLRPPSPTAPRIGRTELLSRLSSIASSRRSAGAVGLLTLFLLIVGIPLGIGLAGAIGGLLMAGGVVVGQAAVAMLGWSGLRTLGAGGVERRRLLLSTLNPFAAPAVSSRLLAEACAGATPLTVACTLLPQATWAAWFRRRAYDAATALTEDREVAEQLEGPAHAIAQVLALRPAMSHQEHWCPRCAATYQPGFTVCRECEVRLLGADELFQPREAGRLASAGSG